MKGDDPDSFYALRALNVKFSSEPHVNRIHEVTPENVVVERGGRAWIVLVMPRSLRIVVFPHKGKETQHLNSNKGITTSPESLAAILNEMKS